LLPKNVATGVPGDEYATHPLALMHYADARRRGLPI
jgi:hypothetical protein